MTEGREAIQPDPERAARWMARDEPEYDVVVTSRIRLARNVRGYPFRARLGEDESRSLEQHLRSRLEPFQFAADQRYVNLEETEALGRELLLESHVISAELARGTGARGVVYSPERHLSVMVNEEDHLRIQRLSPGPALPELLDEMRQLDQALGEILDFAVHPRFGYLTSCPTNVGTGLRLSVMLHLPALVSSKEIEKEFNAAAKMKLAVRGFYGEVTGNRFVGDFFQVSNQVTLGKTSDQLLAGLLKVVPQVVEHERDVRRKIEKEHRAELEDKVFRALGLLRHARRITSQEALELLSQLRLGVCLGLVTDVPLEIINRLLVLSQPAHVQALERRDLEEDERDELRATRIRTSLDPRPSDPTA